MSQQGQVGGSAFDAFWNGSFSDQEEITWDQFSNAIVSSFGINYAEENYSDAVYCIANVFANGSLSKGNKTMSKANCRIFVSIFGPLNELHKKCKDAVDHGFFHGEQTSQESDECFNRTGRKPGSYLIRLRKGAKHQIALAFVDDSGNTKHMLISIVKNGFALHASGNSVPLLSELVELCPNRFVTPIYSNIMEVYGPGSGNRYTSDPNKGIVIEYIKQQVEKTKADAILLIDVSSMGVQRRMKFELSITSDQMLERIARKTPGIDKDKTGAYLNEAGIWLAPGAPLSNYLLTDNSTIEIVDRPEPQNIRVVGINNELARCRDEVMVDSSTTIFGLLRACTKPSGKVGDIVKYGVRITVIAPNVMFFCDPSLMIKDYEIGTRYMDIDVALITSLDSILPPEKVADFIAKSYAALPPSAQPTIHRTTTEMDLTSIQPQPQQQQQQQQQQPPQEPQKIEPQQPKIVQQQLQQQQQQQEEKKEDVKVEENQQKPAAPKKEKVEGMEKEKILEIDPEVFKPINPSIVVAVPDGLPQASPTVIDMAEWMGDMLMLYGWWASRSKEEKENPENITYVANMAKNLFPEKDDPERAKKLTLLKSVLSKEQLVSLFMCLSFVHSLKQ